MLHGLFLLSLRQRTDDSVCHKKQNISVIHPDPIRLQRDLARHPRRQSAAAQYVAEALAEEDVTVTEVSLAPEAGGRVRLTVLLDYRGEALNMAVTV